MGKIYSKTVKAVRMTASVTVSARYKTCDKKTRSGKQRAYWPTKAKNKSGIVIEVCRVKE